MAKVTNNLFSASDERISSKLVLLDHSVWHFQSLHVTTVDRTMNWVPQGSVLEPILCTLYMLPVNKIISKRSILFHCYADDT